MLLPKGEKKDRMSCFTLKLIALITMIIDHIGAIFFPQYIAFRYIGRLSFPIYAFLLSEGFVHTRSRVNYAARLFVFGIISEVPHDLAFSQKVLDLKSLNIMFELYLGVLALSAAETILEKENKTIFKVLSAFLLALILFASAYFNTAYGIYGIVLMLSYYIFRNDRASCAASGAVVSIGFNSFKRVTLPLKAFAGTPVKITSLNPLQSYAAAASIPIYFYNGKLGPHKYKWLFYAIYPMHLLLFYFIKLAIG